MFITYSDKVFQGFIIDGARGQIGVMSIGHGPTNLDWASLCLGLLPFGRTGRLPLRGHIHSLPHLTTTVTMLLFLRVKTSIVRTSLEHIIGCFSFELATAKNWYCQNVIQNFLIPDVVFDCSYCRVAWPYYLTAGAFIQKGKEPNRFPLHAEPRHSGFLSLSIT